MFIFLGEKFELKLLKSDDILLHEEVEDKRSGRLYERFKADKVLFNPLIVGRYKNKYILLDGANRFRALKKIGAKSILAQVLDYTSVMLKLKSWYHFVYEMRLDDLKTYLKNNGLGYSKWEIKSKIKKLNYIGVCGTNGKGIKIKLGKKLDDILGSLCRLNKYYENNYSYTRIDSDSDFRKLNLILPGEGLLFVYPGFKKKHIVKIAGSKSKVPAGLTRHILPNRILHIKYEIEKLISDEELEVRNRELGEIIRNKVELKKVRLYKEPLLIFDE